MAVGVCGGVRWEGAARLCCPFRNLHMPLRLGYSSLTPTYLPHYCHCPWGSGREGGEGGRGGYPLRFLSKLFRCRAVFVPWSFQLRLGLLCLLLVLVLVG